MQNVHRCSCVSGIYFISPQIREFIENTTNIRVYKYDTMKQERKTTLVRTFVQIHCNMVKNERNARRLYYESYDPYTNAIRYWRIREELGDNVVRFT